MDIHLNKLLKRAKAIGYDVVVHDSAKKWFVDEVFTSKFGVRALKRLIQEQVENPLSLLIMQDRIHPGQDVFLNVDDTGRKLRVYAKAGNKEVVPEIAKNPEHEMIKEAAAKAEAEQNEDPVPDIKPPQEAEEESIEAVNKTENDTEPHE